MRNAKNPLTSEERRRLSSAKSLSSGVLPILEVYTSPSPKYGGWVITVWVLLGIGSLAYWIWKDEKLFNWFFR